MSKSPESVSHICRKNSRLAELTQRAAQLARLNHLLQQILPDNFAGHCQLANLQQQLAIIHTDNAAFANMLRFQSAKICQTFSEQTGQTVQQVVVKVRPLSQINRPESHNQLQLSSASAELINQTASSIQDDALKTALHRLAQRCKT